MQYSIVQYRTAQQSTAQYRTEQYRVVQCNTKQCGRVQHSTVTYRMQSNTSQLWTVLLVRKETKTLTSVMQTLICVPVVLKRFHFIIFPTARPLPCPFPLNLLSPDIKMHILITDLHTFLMKLVRRICPNIKTSYHQ